MFEQDLEFRGPSVRASNGQIEFVESRRPLAREMLAHQNLTMLRPCALLRGFGFKRRVAVKDNRVPVGEYFPLRSGQPAETADRLMLPSYTAPSRCSHDLPRLIQRREVQAELSER